LSDHNAQMLDLDDDIASKQEFTSCSVWNVNSFTIDDFLPKLNTEIWKDNFEQFDEYVTFIYFLNFHENL